MSEQGTQQVVKLLVEAHANELALISTLNAHISITESGTYRSLLRNHLRETERHADLIQKRLTQLGYSRSLPVAAYGLVQNTIKQGLVMAKGPIDMIRGRTNVNEKMMRNAMDEAMTEGMEIAAYDTIESVARSVGDHETAELAAQIRVDEEAMLAGLRKEIPLLADGFVRSHISDTIVLEEPWSGYDDMTVDDIKSQLDEASDSLILSVRNYESKNKNRKTIIELTERESVNS
jgi:ferritin-like metal-binding protein YciE